MYTRKSFVHLSDFIHVEKPVQRGIDGVCSLACSFSQILR